MALTLIKEDGTGKVDANSYADVADGNAYHDGHLYATAWTGASDDQKAVALVMASRLIDAEFQFNGTRTNAVQGMQWPRAKCPEPDATVKKLRGLTTRRRANKLMGVSQPLWYVAHTRPRCEKKLLQFCEQEHLDARLPCFQSAHK
jgi:hypothetical protein